MAFCQNDNCFFSYLFISEEYSPGPEKTHSRRFRYYLFSSRQIDFEAF
ncbi:hypothetical protein M116_4090 [Bacteroides fragilis str. 3719 A10]|uniref:Uncharacterized protein n=1 Tax=Bacteroides fragilis str. 3783N1-6 TaxID=1339310 RepID=A0AB73AFB6_BACFG|nr:hypothetical protein M121_3660 [Bacteroides fragilis str. 3783N2-1]EXY54347.1 hypothetical protein M122_3638 [Bacteroides fragilis str. 3976T7]EXZ56401.1 hypothetical protein M116_4090 [Bacteroides fragilis str. 3719 A10]EXZ66238.1 hypothetical protein M120_4312 [Bacteroides fragilis str. 3783N1-8]EYB07843.1 hypothetical protein M119_4104 [Bacteroides fragilis str. 3783N1-6]